jgi:hypothetical protein
MVRSRSFVVLLTAIFLCPAAEPQPPAKEATGISLTDQAVTIKWIADKSGQYFQRRDNELAQADILAELKKELAKHEGKKLTWKMHFSSVSLDPFDKKTAIVHAVPNQWLYIAGTGTKKDLSFPLSFTGFPVPADEKWLKSLKLGDTVTLKATWKTSSLMVEKADPFSFDLRITLSDCSISP